MSNLQRTASNVIDGLSRGEAVEVALPNGGVVRAVPSRVVDVNGNPITGPNGHPVIELQVQSNTLGGEVHALIRMEENSFNYFVEKARNMMPRLQVIQQRLLLRSGNG